MSGFMERTIGWLRRFTVSSGRHRAGRPSAVRPARSASAGRLPSDCSPLAPTVQAWYEPIDGTTTRLVRPYLAAYEREEKVRLQRLRRDTLWCATYGVDLDTRDIHARLEAA